MAESQEIEGLKKVPSDEDAEVVLRTYSSGANRISGPIERAEFLKTIEYLKNNTLPKQVALVAKPPVNISSWKIVLGVVLCGFLGWFCLQSGIDILFSKTLTYTKNGFTPKTVSPSSGAFEFCYQVAFFLTLGHYCPVKNRIDSVGCMERPRGFCSRCPETLAARSSSRTG